MNPDSPRGTDVPPARALSDAELDEGIQTLWDRIEARNRTNVEDARTLGAYLNEKYARVGWGGWGRWLTEHFPGRGRTTAHVYRTIADHWEEVKHAQSIEEARDIIAGLNRAERSDEAPTPAEVTQQAEEEWAQRTLARLLTERVRSWRPEWQVFLAQSRTGEDHLGCLLEDLTENIRWVAVVAVRAQRRMDAKLAQLEQEPLSAEERHISQQALDKERMLEIWEHFQTRKWASSFEKEAVLALIHGSDIPSRERCRFDGLPTLEEYLRDHPEEP